MTQDAVRKLCAGLWARCNKKLTSYELTYQFLCELAVESGARMEAREGGIFVFSSPLETAPESSAAAVPTSHAVGAEAGYAGDGVQ